MNAEQKRLEENKSPEASWHSWGPYLAERGITEKTALEFGVGFYAGPGLMHGRLVIPIHNADGELVAYCGRSVDQMEPRYRIPPAFAKSEILFNMHRASSGQGNFVVVVEGFFDCMKVHQAGVRSVVGLMGSALYEAQRHVLLEKFRHVILLRLRPSSLAVVVPHLRTFGNPQSVRWNAK